MLTRSQTLREESQETGEMSGRPLTEREHIKPGSESGILQFLALDDTHQHHAKRKPPHI